jgi:hypothetical protein
MLTRLFAASVLLLSACGGLNLMADDSLTQASLTVTRVQIAGKTVSAYVVFDQSFDGPLEMRLFDRDDADGVEIGRSVVRVREQAGAHYIDFIFDPRTPVHKAAAVLIRTDVGGSAAGDSSALP